MFKVIFLLITCTFLQTLTEESKGITIANVDREVDIASQIVRETLKYEIENSDTSPVAFFIQAIEKEKLDHIASIQALFGENKKTNSVKFDLVTIPGSPSEYAFYKLMLPEPIATGKKLKFIMNIFYTHLLEPFPTHIIQKESQFIKFYCNQYVNSVYNIKKQTTVFKLAPGTVESYTKIPTAKQEGSKLTYGPYENTKPYTNSTVHIHYENNSPFLTVNQLTRLIEVSHWGNIAIEEVVNVSHTGAILRGSFSRYDFQRDTRSADKMPCVKSFKAFLPASAKDVYYRDEIGNISTSHLRQKTDIAELEIRPRFPLFGGWKTHYTIGYNVPSYEYLYTRGNRFALKMRFVDHIFKNYVVDDMVLKIILPEGSKDIEVVTPYQVKRMPDEVHYTYLDFSGRPVVVLAKKNLIEEHIKDFEIHYSFDRFNMVYEPLLIVAAFLLLFLVVIVYVRLDFTISKDAGEKLSAASEQKLEATPAAKKSTKKQQ